jgi:opacity protein-like surface antigen
LDVRFGTKAGLVAASMSGTYVEIPVSALASTGTQPRTGFALGGYVIVGFRESLFLQSELLYVQKGHQLNLSGLGRSATVTWNSSYLEIPVLARFEIPIGAETLDIPLAPYVVGGPTVGLAISASGEINDDGVRFETNFDDNISSTDLGLAVGVGTGYHLDSGMATIELRYIYGLSNIVPDSGLSAGNRSLMLTVGFVF